MNGPALRRPSKVTAHPAKRLVVSGKGSWIAGGLLALWLVAPRSCSAVVDGSDPAGLALFFGVFAIASLVPWLLSRREGGVPGTIEVAQGDLWFQDQRLCLRSDIERAFLLPRRRGDPIVTIERKGGRPLRFAMPSVDAGRALIRALELDPRQNVTSFTLPGRNQGARAAVFALSAVAGILGLLAAVVLWSPLGLVAAGLSVPLYLTFLRLTRTRLQIGLDGVHIQSPGKTRFIDHRDIRGVATHRASYLAVDITLESGETLRLPTATHAEGDGGLAAGIADMLSQARRQGRTDAAEEASALARKGRSAADWLRAMRALAAGANIDHRTPPIDPERVWRVLEDPAAEPSARVGAAAVLSSTAGEGDRARIRIAARAVAAPKVRVALEALTEADDEAAILEALEGVHEPEDAARPRRRADPGRG